MGKNRILNLNIQLKFVRFVLSLYSKEILYITHQIYKTSWIFSTKLILWDESPADKEVMVAFDGEALHTFIVDMDNVGGPSATYLGKSLDYFLRQHKSC